MAETTAPAAASSPASASSAPSTSAPASSAPASTSTPAAAGAPASSAAAPVAAAAPDTRSTEQILAEALSKGPSLVPEPAKTEEAAAAVTEEKPAAAAAAGESDDPTRTAEEQAAIDAAAAEGKDGTKPAAATADDEDKIDFGFDDDEQQETAPVDPKALSAKIEADPALKAAIEANPELKAEIFANSRIAARVEKYESIFANPEEAAVSHQMSETYGGVRNAMIELKPGDVQSTRGVIDTMLQAASLRNEDGTVAKNPDGTYKSDGTVGRFLSNAFDMRLEMLENEAKAANDEETLAALDTIKARSGKKGPTSPGESEDDLSEREKALVEQNRQLQTEKEQQASATLAAHNTAVDSRTDRMVETNINQFIDRSTGLTDFNKGIVKTNIGGDLVKAIQSNPRYQEELNLIMRQPIGLPREKAEVALAAKWLAAKLPKIARERLAEAGAQVTASEKGKEAKQAARLEASKGETRTAMSPTKPTSGLTGQALMDQIYSDFKAKNGRDPNTHEYLAEKMNRSSAAA